MADFNVSVADPQLTARPVQPVQDNSAAQGINSLSSLFADTGRVASKAIVAGQAQVANANSERILGQIKDNILVKADAVDQGWSSDKALRATRRQLSKDLANHPTLAKEITELYSQTLTKTGLGGNIVDGTKAEADMHDARMAVFNDMMKTGAAPADLDPASPEAGRLMDNYQQYRLHATNLEAANAELDHKRKEIGLQTDVVQLAGAKQSYVTGGITQQNARLNLATKQAEIRSRVAITNGAANYNQLLSTNLADINKKFKDGTYTAQEASIQVDQAMAQVQATAQSMGPEAGSDYVKNTLSPMLSLGQSFKDSFSGKLDADSLQNQLNATKSKMSLAIIHNNPKVLPIIATSDLLGQLPPEVTQKITSFGLSMIGYDSNTDTLKGLDPTDSLVGPALTGGKNKPTPVAQPKLPDVTANDEHTKGFIAFAKGGIERVLAGQGDTVKEAAETNKALNTAIKSVNKYGNTVDKPADLYDLMHLFASPSFGKFSKSGALVMSQDDKNEANKVLTTNYTEHALPIIREEYLKSVAITGSTTAAGSGYAAVQGNTSTQVANTPDIIVPTFNGTGVTFVAKDPTNETVAIRVKALNKNLSPTMNLIINARANLTNSNPKDAYDSLVSQIVPQDSQK